MDKARRLTLISETTKNLQTQDNRCTANPMFCVQIKVRDAGYDIGFYDNHCWFDPEEEYYIFDDDPDFKGDPLGRWREYSYRDRWETVMVAFTEKGCNDYLAQDGHNLKRRAHNGAIRIYVDSFNRCDEMIAIRDQLLWGEAEAGAE